MHAVLRFLECDQGARPGIRRDGTEGQYPQSPLGHNARRKRHSALNDLDIKRPSPLVRSTDRESTEGMTLLSVRWTASKCLMVS